MNTTILPKAARRLRVSFVSSLLLMAVLAISPALHADVGYQFVTIGDPGNADDTVPANDGSGFYGGVNYIYDIGKYDVTLSQYTTFLNAVANTDPYGLYNTSMGTDLNVAGIARSGSAGIYTYSVVGDGNRPAAYISWFDAARFSNWLQNGQPSGEGEIGFSTEDGAYTLDGATSGIILKNVNALYWIPTESEWYKAAYYDPTLNGGAGGYWQYATRSNMAPGNVVGSTTNQANYNNGVYSATQSSTFPSGNALTDVGAFANSASYYGTYDQNGDLLQWNDSVISGASRGLRGGSWGLDATSLESSSRYARDPAGVDASFGFRIATVPEPDVAISFILASGLLLARRRRH